MRFREINELSGGAGSSDPYRNQDMSYGQVAVARELEAKGYSTANAIREAKTQYDRTGNRVRVDYGTHDPQSTARWLRAMGIDPVQLGKDVRGEK